ncbi:MAG: hypothetical protein Q8R00_01925 [Candidatus Nanoarchaeia archaeon]|nr:hypothetical protein [Candidatus Nanoarchaeia archaeon]
MDLFHAHRYVTEEYSLLKDEPFLSRYPGIDKIAAFLYHTIVSCDDPNESPIPLFKEYGITDIGDYLNLLNKNWPMNRKAVKYYKVACESFLEKFIEIIERQEKKSKS